MRGEFPYNLRKLLFRNGGILKRFNTIEPTGGMAKLERCLNKRVVFYKPTHFTNVFSIIFFSGIRSRGPLPFKLNQRSVLSTETRSGLT